MSKSIPFVLAFALLLSLCSPAIAASDPAFPDSVEAQSFAVAMAYHDGGYYEGITPSDTSFLWDATAWYAAWLYRTCSVDVLTEDQVHDFQLSIGASASALPPAWAESSLGLRVLRSSDGTLFYDFTASKNRIDTLLGQTLSFSVETTSSASVAVTLEQYYSLNASGKTCYHLSFMHNRNSASSFPYSLRNVDIEESEPVMDPELDFEWGGLLAANSLRNIFSAADAVEVQNSSGDLSSWVFSFADHPCLLYVREDSIEGQYRNFWFSLQTSAGSDQRPCITDADIADGDNQLNSYISDFLQGATTVSHLSSSEDSVQIHMTFPGGWEQDALLDRGILFLKELSSRFSEDSEPFVTTFRYTSDRPSFSFLESWRNDLRKITVIWEDWYTGERRLRTTSVEIPSDWEYIPWEGQYGDYTIYMNEDYTLPYSYPGDEVEYTLYLTTAKG